MYYLLFPRKKKDYEPAVDKSFFSLLVIQLLVVVQQPDGTWEPERVNGALHLRTLDEMPRSFWEQVGENTNYLIHPEETVADNYKLIFQPSDLIPNPEIVSNIANYLK